MSISQTQFLSEILGDGLIPQEKRAYFQARLRARIYEHIVGKFLQCEAAGEMTRADLARRLDCDPAQVTRYLSSPQNWRLDTVSDWMLAVCKAELEIGDLPLANRPPRNQTAPDFMEEQTTATSGPRLTPSNDDTAKSTMTITADWR